MESDKTKKRRVIAPNFHKYPELALQLLEDEKKAREAMRKRAELGIKTEIPEDIDKIIKEAEVA